MEDGWDVLKRSQALAPWAFCVHQDSGLLLT
jgi:hypothetical protein